MSKVECIKCQKLVSSTNTCRHELKCYQVIIAGCSECKKDFFEEAEISAHDLTHLIQRRTDQRAQINDRKRELKLEARKKAIELKARESIFLDQERQTEILKVKVEVDKKVFENQTEKLWAQVAEKSRQEEEYIKSVARLEAENKFLRETIEVQEKTNVSNKTALEGKTKELEECQRKSDNLLLRASLLKAQIDRYPEYVLRHCDINGIAGGQSEIIRAQLFWIKESKLEEVALKSYKIDSIQRLKEQEIHRKLKSKSNIRRMIDIHLAELNANLIVFEYYQGVMSGFNTKQNCEQITSITFAEVFIQMARSIQILQENEILHLDVKPQNYFYNRDQSTGAFNIYLGDFGYSYQFKPEDKMDEQMNKQFDTAFGTANYQSPEMNRYKKASKATDIYSLGKSFLRILFSEKPITKDYNQILNDLLIDPTGFTTLKFLQGTRFLPEKRIPIFKLMLPIIAQMIFPEPLKRITTTKLLAVLNETKENLSIFNQD